MYLHTDVLCLCAKPHKYFYDELILPIFGKISLWSRSKAFLFNCNFEKSIFLTDILRKKILLIHAKLQKNQPHYGKILVSSIIPECDEKVNSSAEQFQSNS